MAVSNYIRVTPGVLASVVGTRKGRTTIPLTAHRGWNSCVHYDKNCKYVWRDWMDESYG
jgi:hypothetical protein